MEEKTASAVATPRSTRAVTLRSLAIGNMVFLGVVVVVSLALAGGSSAASLCFSCCGLLPERLNLYCSQKEREREREGERDLYCLMGISSVGWKLDGIQYGNVPCRPTRSVHISTVNGGVHLH